MITRLEYMAHAEVLLHPRVVGLRAHLQLFFLRLYFMTDGAARFKADAAVIRASLYAHELQQVSKREVESRLQELHRARLIKLYTEGDVGYGKVADDFWQQSDTKRKVRHPAPVHTGPAPGLFDEPAAAESPPAGVGKKGAARVCVSGPPLTSLQSNLIQADQRPAEECLAELAPRYPRHDLRACLRDARRYVRKQRGEEAEVTVGWFVAHWMPFAAEKKRDALPGETAAQAATRAADAARWQQQQADQLKALLDGPEPEKGTLDHAIWLEGRKSA